MIIVIAFSITFVFGIIAILLSLENDKKKKLYLFESEMLKKLVRKLSLLYDIQNKTSYTLDTEKATDIIMGNLRSLFPYSLASSLVIKNKHLIFTTYAQESVGNSYIEKVKESMLSSLSQLSNSFYDKIDQRAYGVSLSNGNSQMLDQTFSSSFHIPLVVNNKVVALIHLSSTKPNLYKDKDMEVLYQIVEQVGSSLTSLNGAIDMERNIFISLVNGIDEGIFMTDNKSDLLILNNALRKILGIDKPNVIFADIVSVFPASFNLVSKINEAILNKKTINQKAIKVKEKILDLFISPLENNRVSITLHDVTEEVRTANLKEEFMHIMIHELRAPISTIKDASELLISMDEALEKDKKLKFLEIIHNQSKSILDQVGSILDTAKLQAGKFSIEKVEGDLGRLIKDEIESFMPQAERKHILLTYDILNPLPLIYFDPIRISQVFNNLISNSLKFTPEGGTVKIEADYKPMPPNLSSPSQKEILQSLEKYIVVSVSDNGIGIDKDQQKFLFSKFSQAKNTPEELTKLGSGLGLYLVKGIIEAHGGKVWIRSLPSKGTTITFAIPAHQTHTEASQDDPPTQTPSIN
ncbi:GAF domain-containing sensor histidine kinase [Candidatus Roizmanbacteria bacterium]|nr:GAF domain-containing sensor histidine kinase [Candidatus Roizmanbacteria bacterium]